MNSIRESLNDLLLRLSTHWRGRTRKPWTVASTKEAEALERLLVDYPKAIHDIEKDYGFHFDNGNYLLIDETERMFLYTVIATEADVDVRPDSKPVLIAHPYVLGPNILAFLPEERKSYIAIRFANQGIPTYVRIIKDIHSNPAVQMMTGEEDVLDTKLFSEIIVGRHGKPLTLNGVCQGGFIFLAGLLSGEFEDLVDTLIICNSPIDGTRNDGMKRYIDKVITGSEVWPMLPRDCPTAIVS